MLLIDRLVELLVLHFLASSLLGHIFFLTSCRSLDYADKYENVKWTSADPTIEFVVVNDNNGWNEGTLKVNDETVDILCCWMLNNSLWIYYKDKIDFNDETTISEDSIALRGGYKIKKGIVTITLAVDNVYDNRYEKITFTMTEL